MSQGSRVCPRGLGEQKIRVGRDMTWMFLCSRLGEREGKVSSGCTMELRGAAPSSGPGHAQGQLMCFLILMEIGNKIIIQTFKHDSLLCVVSDIMILFLFQIFLYSFSLYSMLSGLHFNQRSKHYFAIIDFFILFTSIFWYLLFVFPSTYS